MKFNLKHSLEVRAHQDEGQAQTSNFFKWAIVVAVLATIIISVTVYISVKIDYSATNSPTVETPK